MCYLFETITELKNDTFEAIGLKRHPVNSRLTESQVRRGNSYSIKSWDIAYSSILKLTSYESVPTRVTLKVIGESGFQIFPHRRDSIPPRNVGISGHDFPS
jgi:hypothetical protein